MEVAGLNLVRKAAVSYDNRRNRLKVRQKSEEVRKVKGNLQKKLLNTFLMENYLVWMKLPSI